MRSILKNDMQPISLGAIFGMLDTIRRDVQYFNMQKDI
jgi:hypothetical protein